MNGSVDDSSVGVLRREVQLLERLLDVGAVVDPVAFLEEALAVCMERVDALRGYIALLHPSDDPAQPRWWHAVDCSAQQVGELRRAFSSGLVAEAVRNGKTVLIANALLDPSWSLRESIRRNRVEAVLCGPIGGAERCGVLYLQRRPGAEPFRPADVERVERLASWIAPIARRLLSELADTDPTARLRARLDVADLVGRSEAMAHLLEQIRLASRFDVTVLLTGPTGAGKSAIARAIGRNSARRQGPFVEVNAASLGDELFCAQLFGVAPGAFTDAPRQGRDGLVGAASGGTLFLDEVGDIGPAGQVALLQFLEGEQVYRRVGDSASRRADVRVIAASNVDLRQAVEQGRFREDLLQRLSTVVVRVPGLDERVDDVGPLAEHLLQRAADRHRLAARPFTPAALHALVRSSWPGNVRELEKAVERGLLWADTRDLPYIGVEELGVSELSGDATWQAATRRFQRELLRNALREQGGDLQAVMRQLDLSRGHLYRLLAAHGLELER